MFQSDSVAFTASAGGIFFPPSGLPGFIAAEMATSEPLATRLGKFSYAFSKQVANYCDANPDIVGLAVNRSENTVTDRYGVKEKVYQFVISQITDDRTNGVAFPPVAGSGIRAGLADFSFNDIFPNAVKIASGATTPGAGIIIHSDAIAAESVLDHASINLSGDCRELFRAIVSALFTNRAIRTAETASALVTASYGNDVAATLPATWTQALNPYTALTADDARYVSVKRRNISFTIETIENEDLQTFDVNSIVTPA
jgi:hypothetical protein